MVEERAIQFSSGEPAKVPSRLRQTFTELARCYCYYVARLVYLYRSDRD